MTDPNEETPLVPPQQQQPRPVLIEGTPVKSRQLLLSDDSSRILTVDPSQEKDQLPDAASDLEKGNVVFSEKEGADVTGENPGKDTKDSSSDHPSGSGEGGNPAPHDVGGGQGGGDDGDKSGGDYTAGDRRTSEGLIHAERSLGTNSPTVPGLLAISALSNLGGQAVPPSTMATTLSATAPIAGFAAGLVAYDTLRDVKAASYAAVRASVGK